VRALTTAGLRLLEEADRPRDQRLKKKAPRGGGNRVAARQ